MQPAQSAAGPERQPQAAKLDISDIHGRLQRAKKLLEGLGSENLRNRSSGVEVQ